MARIEAVRLEAGRRMGLGDVRDSVLPKPVLLAPGAQPMALRSRYFTPRSCHRSHAATGAVGVACAFLIPGTVAHGFGGPEPAAGSRGVRIEHPSGRWISRWSLVTTASRYGAPVWCAPRERS